MLRETSRKAESHFDRAIALYDPAEHRPLATRFSADSASGNLVLSVAGPVGCLAIRRPRSRTPTRRSGMRARSAKLPRLMYALWHASCHSNPNAEIMRAASAQLPMKLSHWRTKKDRVQWKALGTSNRGCVLALTGEASDAVQMITDRDHRSSVNRINELWLPCVSMSFGEGLCGTRPIR